MTLVETITALIAMFFTALAMGFDVKMRRIPNSLTISALVAGIAFHTLTAGLPGLGFSLMGFAAGFSILLVLWLIGGGGGGDVKLMGALGAWVGGPVILIIFIGSALTAITWMVVTLIGRAMRRTQPVASGKPSNVTVNEDKSSNGLLPYAIPVAITTWIWMLTKLVLPTL